MDVDHEISKLKITGDCISKDFSQIQKKTEYLAEYTEALYKKGAISKNEFIEESEFGYIYKSADDGGSAIFISSLAPFSIELKNVINITHPLDSVFRDVADSLQSLVKQLRYDERHSLIRVYPYVDVQAQYAPDFDIRMYSFYFCADDLHNPEKNIVLISNPYVDPSGRGWMVSSVAPVYHNRVFQGVIGLDITVDAIKMKYVKKNPSDVMILDSNGICIAIDDAKSGVFNIPVKKAHKYMQSANIEDYSNDEINLLKSKNKKIRTAFESLIKEKMKSVELTIGDEEYCLFSYMIPDVNWFIIKYKKI
ncbi:MAG: hypothetical protein V1904_04755 [Bacteroidota bacterium]